ncbi:MAG: YebC/PmpR family DNA-binding transcriptional regulator [Gammaproteobacteria bacterium]|nr:YebC/PmpR family DNA-binding transcriptional regulator [Gammaproteobacteria bacterium]
MAGHSKWANIQHRKKAQDAKRGKLFTRLIRELTVAARMGGSDQDSNPRLRLAVEKALAGNMPKDTMERAIKRGAGELEGVNYEEVRYEGYGPGGAAIMVDCLTDNRNRTVADVRHAFNKHGGNLGADGSVSYMFHKFGVLSFAPGAKEEHVMHVALDSGADDVIVADDGSIEVLTSADDYATVVSLMVSAGFEPDDSMVEMRADNQADLDPETAEQVASLIEALDELDDTQEVSSNVVLPLTDIE